MDILLVSGAFFFSNMYRAHDQVLGIRIHQCCKSQFVTVINFRKGLKSANNSCEVPEKKSDSPLHNKI